MWAANITQEAPDNLKGDTTEVNVRNTSFEAVNERLYRLEHEVDEVKKDVNDQRVSIARALAAEPDLIICDEPTSALDQLVADEILKLLKRLQDDLGVAYLFITHDLGIVRRIAHRTAVMLRGEIIAEGPTERIFSPPFHPYTEKLLASVPELRTDWLEEVLAKREPGGKPKKAKSKV